MIRRLSLTLWAAIFALVGAVCLLRPVYTDEFVWKFFQSRLWSDDMRNIAVIMMPSCEAYLVSPPAFMIPFRWLDNVLYGTPTLIWLRISGFTTLAIWVVLTIALMGAALRRAGIAVSRSVTTLALLSVMMLGHMPVLLTTNRPEQPALIGLTFAFLVPFAMDRQVDSVRSAGLAAVLVLDAAWMFSSHPRTIYFVPVFLAAIWILARPVYLRLLASAIVVVLAVVAAQHWGAWLACPGDPVVAAGILDGAPLLALQTMSIPMFVLFWVKHVYWALQSFIGVLRFTYLAPVLFLAPNANNWPDQGRVLHLVESGVDAAIGAGLLALGVACVGTILRLGIHVIRGQRIPASFHMLWVMAACLTLIILSQLTKNDYESVLVIPFAIMLAPLCWAVLTQVARPEAAAGGVPLWPPITLAALCILAGISGIAFVSRYAPVAARLWLNDQPYLPETPLDIPLSLQAGTFDRQIKDTAAMCGLKPGPDLQHLVVDELTYSSFTQGREPYMITYLTGYWGTRIPNLRKYLEAKISSGMIVGCHRLPPELRAMSRQSGPFCCVRFADPSDGGRAQLGMVQ